MVRALSLAPNLAGPLLRMHFHDCFVSGCDGSVLLDSANKTAEKDAQPNQTLRGFGFVERVKAAVEKACPDTVSCADILALIARDAVWLDLVVLSAGHTIGTSHCFSFSDRLYNFTGMENPSDIDPTLEPQYMMRLKSKCASLNDNTTLVEMDPGSFKTFDTDYFKLVSKRRGLFHSDGALLTDPFTRAYVQRHATGAFKDEFFADFAASMIKMGNANQLTGSQGEIRKKCSVVNH
uniref:Peroxidase n=1 Tax=Aegilops tauschii TaxID=37682 RepID=R7W059_AEGTA